MVWTGSKYIYFYTVTEEGSGQDLMPLAIDLDLN